MRYLQFGSDSVSARVTVIAAATGPRFTLYPMMHIADRSFHEQVKAEADGFDLVMYEGAHWRGLPSPVSAKPGAEGAPIHQAEVVKPAGSDRWMSVFAAG
ncbi:MAG: hypothetical protein AAGI70_16870 [Pseudomonadota bacterium]